MLSSWSLSAAYLLRQVLSHPQVEFMAITPHVAAILENLLSKLNIDKDVLW